MDKFLPSIKQKYKDRLINCEKQWPPCHSNKLVRLELVEREKGKGYCDNIPRGSLERREKEARCNYKDQYSNNKEKTVRRTSLAYNSLFIEKGGKKPVRKVLVEGDAGIGKTTLSVSISEDWSCDKLFQEFELVLLLPLRHKKVASAGSLPELLKLLHPSADVCKSVASYLEEEEAKKVLVIADGWDELSETERQEGSFLYELLFETFPLMSVVVTSRPFASAPLHRLPCIDRFVEINGFGKDDIKEYIHCEFSSEHEKACRLLEQLEDNPLVESVCSVPLNCAIVCHLWRTSEEVLPSTMTQLYTKIILNVILRNIRKKDSFKNILSLPNFDALPKELQQSFRLLCEFAFETLKKNHIVFSQDELAEFFPEGFALDEKILCFGLLQSADTILETGYGMSFHFLHLTFMEFLAALHLSEQPQSTLLEMLKLNDQCFVNNVPSIYAIETRGPLYTSDFNIVWRFFFGIKFFDYKIEGEDIHIMLIILKYFTLIGDFHWIMFPCHCAFESQNDLITQKASQLLQESSLSTRSYFSTLKSAHDFAVVLHVIATIQGYCHNNIIILSYCGVREHQIRRLTDILASKQGKLSIQELDLSGNKLSGECLSDLFHRASAAFQKDDNHIPCLEMLDSCRLSQSTRGGLSYLDLSYIPFEAQLLENLALYQKNIFSNLSTLNLKGCLNGAADTNAKVLNTFIKALSTNCPHMEQLNLSSNNLCVPGASVVAKGVSRFQKYLEVSDSILELCLDNTNLGNEGLKAFVENLDGVYNFAVLSLCGNSIHAAGISYLAEAVCSSRIVMRKEFCYSLDLSDNPLGLEGAIAIGRMLSSSHCQFTDIILCRCKLTTTETAFSNTDSVSHSSISSESAIMDISRQLCLMPQNRIIEILDVSGNSFTGEGIHTLVGIMHQCASLVLLYCSDCGITSDDLILFFNKISRLKTSSPDVCSKLYSWDLSNNKIDDRSALVVIGYLQAIFSHGFFPNFSGNCSEILKRINDEINKKFYEKCSKYLSKEYQSESKAETTDSEAQILESLPTQLPLTTHSVEAASSQTVCVRRANPWPQTPPQECPLATGERPNLTQDSDKVKTVVDVHFAPPTNQPVPEPPRASPLVAASTNKIEEQRSCDQSCDSSEAQELSTPLSSPVPSQFDHSTIILQDNEQSLSVDDLRFVIEAVWKARAKWYNIGLQLGLTSGTLDAIRLTNHYIADQCFTETFKEWLIQSKHPTWSDLARALRTKSVGEGQLAEELLNLHSSTKTESSQPSAVS